MKEQFDLVTLKSGHKSLRLANTQQTFHPGIGPLAEATILHVRGQNLIERCQQPGKFVIWDVGFGASANAIVAIEALKDCRADVEIFSFERSLEPIRFALEHATELGYLVPHVESIRALLEQGSIQLRPNLKWTLVMGDFRKTFQNSDVPAPQAIFYDPYSVSVNRELWTLDFFSQLRMRLDDQVPCLLTNYTRSTALRVTWLLAGFFVGVGSTIGEKEETSVASNRLEALARPLDRKWLERVRVSQNASPISESRLDLAPISEADWQTLLAHPQFN